MNTPDREPDFIVQDASRYKEKNNIFLDELLMVLDLMSYKIMINDDITISFQSYDKSWDRWTPLNKAYKEYLDHICEQELLGVIYASQT